MSTNHQHIIYTAEDIKRYLEGSMSSNEMHAMEKAALDDPLLADAIEGYAGAAEEDWSSVLAELKNKVITKEESAPVIDIKNSTHFKWWKAAAVLLIGITGTIAYLMKSQKEQANVAKTESTPSLDSSVAAIIKADSIDEKTVAIQEVPGKESGYLSNETQADRSNEIVSEQKGNSVKEKADFVYKPDFKTSDPKKQNQVTYFNKAADDEEKEVTVQNAAPAAPSTSNNSNSILENYAAEQNRETNTQRSVMDYERQKEAAGFIKQQYQLKGNVVNQNGEPVSFASLKINTPKNQFLTTDAKGNFSFAAADSTLNVEIASAGYAPGNFKLKANTNNGIVLQPSNSALNEVVISSNVPKDKLAKKRVTTVDDELEETAEPTGGWDSYNNYLDNNVHLPANNQNIQGTVEALVKVNRKGQIDEVKITQSLNTECDKEAVRLIKSGPGWKIKSGKKGYGKVKVRFQR